MNKKILMNGVVLLLSLNLFASIDVLRFDNFEAPGLPAWGIGGSYGISAPGGTHVNEFTKGSCAGSSGGGDSALYVRKVFPSYMCGGGVGYEYDNGTQTSGTRVDYAMTAINATCHNNLTLEFDFKIPGGNVGSDYARVGFNGLLNTPAFYYFNLPTLIPGTSNWTHVSTNFPTYIYDHSTLMLRFEWLYDNSGVNQYPLAIDNVLVKGERFLNNPRFTDTCISNCGSAFEIHQLDGSASSISFPRNINQWNWIVTPTMGVTLNGQGSINPTLTFNTTGTWNVCLTVNDTSSPYPPYCETHVECQDITVSAPLATDVVTLYADQKESSILLNWEITNATEPLNYTIERRRENSSPKLLVSNLPFDQKVFEDTDLESGRYYYRVLAKNSNGDVWHSRELSLFFDATKEMQVFPNPVTNLINVKGIPVEKKFIFNILNAKGQEVFSSLETVSWDGLFSLEFESFPAGKYILQYKAGRKVKSIHFVKI